MSTRSPRPLTTTSYAILGVLALRPWSAYDLTGYMRLSAVRRFWPRTESRLYAEPKNLVAHGFAESTKEYTGKRSRTVYRITEDGRRALREWLGQAPARPETQDEALLKILLADQGSRDQLLVTIRRAMEELFAQVTTVGEIADRLAQGEARFPERLHVNALTSRHAIEIMRGRFEFLRWADGWVRTWDDTDLDEKKREEAQEVLAESRRELRKIDAGLREMLGRNAEEEALQPTG